MEGGDGVGMGKGGGGVKESDEQENAINSRAPEQNPTPRSRGGTTLEV